MTDPPMIDPCQQFQLSLLGRLNEGSLSFLSEQEQAHVVGCSACRNMLKEEQALEGLMNEDRQLDLSAASTERLVKRLHSRLDAAIWTMLDQDAAPTPPPDLSDRVLARLHEAAELTPMDTPRPRANQWLRVAVLAAAAVLVFWFAPWRQEPGNSSEHLTPEALLAELSPEEVELLDWLDVLEQWDTLRQVTPIEADTLTTLAAGDLLLLDLGEAN